MSKISFLDCPHNNVQDFTECCMDCGYNIWTTKEQYLQSLREEAERRFGNSEIRALEKKLGIGTEG